MTEYEDEMLKKQLKNIREEVEDRLRKKYDKYVTKSLFALTIGIVFVFISFATDDKFLSKYLILFSFAFLGLALIFMVKERNK